MPELLIKEKVFDTACLLIGWTGRAFGFKIKHPIFLIGTGRCGSTLLWRILRSHPDISGFPTEANEIWHPKCLSFESYSPDEPPMEVDPKRFSEFSIAQWPSNQGKKIRDIFTGFNLITGLSRVFFTKSAMVSFMIPKILEIFPDARFIHIYRFGPSVVESLFKKNFGKFPRYPFSEKEYRIFCSKFWNDCIFEIDKRERELSLKTNGQFFEVSYEDLCANPRKCLDDLSDYLRVPPEGYRYDISKVTSQNYKVNNYINDPQYAEMLDLMSSGMKLKGYLKV